MSKHVLQFVKGIIVVMCIISERAKRASSVMFVFNRDFRYVRMYIYVAIRQGICACSVVRNVGGVKCQPLSKA